MRFLAVLAACLIAAAPIAASADPQPLASSPTGAPQRDVGNGQQTAALTPPRAGSVQAGPQALAVADPSYVLGAGDEIRISVFGEPDLTVEQRLGPQGDISVPLIGDIRAGGMSSAQLSDAIEAKYSDGFLVNPQVSVSIAQYRPFYVVGEVARPGAYPYAADLTAMSAIAFAGGFNERANRSRLFVKRAGEQNETAVPANQTITLNPGDTVRVGEGMLSNIRQIPLGWLAIF